jgi:predicted nucleotidyltransferase
MGDDAMARPLSDLDETTDSYVERLRDRLRSHVGDRLVSLVLYGSRARGTHRNDSDIDVLIVIDGLSPDRAGRHALLRPIKQTVDGEHARERGRPAPHLAYIVKTPEEAAHHAPLYLDMTEDAILVWDRDGFFGGVLEGLRRRMAELGSRRIWLGEGWYWILKPDMRWGERVVL